MSEGAPATDLKKIAAEMRLAAREDMWARSASAALLKHAAALDALAAQEPVAKFVQSPYGNYPELKWRAGYSARIGDCVYAAPQPAPPQPEPATMIETIPVDETHELRKIDGFWQLFTVREGSWVRSLNGYECEFVDCAIRSAALQTAARLAAPQRMTVSREALCKALRAFGDEHELHLAEQVADDLTRVFRALGIEVK